VNIVILNGSPKGSLGVTVHCALYLQKKYPEHTFDVQHIAKRISTLEKDEAAFEEVVGRVRRADAVLWAFPLYYLSVCGQYKRFIELVWERGATDAFAGKYAAALTTSVHFFDHTARNYIHAVSEDLAMPFFGGYCGEMFDLTRPVEQQRLACFAEGFFEAVEHRLSLPRTFSPLPALQVTYQPGEADAGVGSNGRKIVVVADIEDSQDNLSRMVDYFTGCFAEPVEVVNLYDMHIAGGCLGCLQCSLDNVCVYHGRDDFIDFFENTVKTADVLVFAGALHDRHLSARWKMFLDRSFYNNHVPVLTNKQVGCIVAGPLSHNANLREMLEAYVTFSEANLVGFVSDEAGSSADISDQLASLARRLLWCAQHDYVSPPTFLAVGGKKILRDKIWGPMRFIFQADHRYYKKHGYYDFPQRSLGTRVRNAVMMTLMRIPAVRRKFMAVMKQKMVEPHRKVVDDVRDEPRA